MLFESSLTLEKLNAMGENCMVGHLGIEFTEIGPDYLTARMPVNSQTTQPMGLLHGGASVALAETLGSVAATCCLDSRKQYCVGLEINANHIKSARQGFVTGTTRPVHIGKRTQIWEIRIHNEQDQIVCISRITLAVMDIK